MHDKPKGAGDDPRTTTATEDDRTEATVLREVLFLYPESLTLEELIRQMTIASTEFPDIDQVQRAVRELTAAGLLHRVGDLVLPTRAAVRFHELVEL
jgi:hypothetical protein